jgi:hypothetical protein
LLAPLISVHSRDTDFVAALRPVNILPEESTLLRIAQYGVKFVGYSAYVMARKYGREIQYATLDFISDVASMHANGGWVMVDNRVDLGPFLRNLPNLASELEQLLCRHVAQALEEGENTGTAGDMITLSKGQNEVCIAPDTDVNKFIRQITKRFFEVKPVLDQAYEIGSRIKRRPYSEYLDEIKKTGIAGVESHGFGLFIDGKVSFYPDYQVAFVRPTGERTFEVNLLDEIGRQSIN